MLNWCCGPTWLPASNKPPAHQIYEVIRALRIWGGLHRPTFVFDVLTTDNSTGIQQKWRQSVPRYSTNLRRIIWVGSPENRRWKNIWLRIRRRICVDPRWPLHELSVGGGKSVKIWIFFAWITFKKQHVSSLQGPFTCKWENKLDYILQ
jgi:hypothetical protein